MEIEKLPLPFGEVPTLTTCSVSIPILDRPMGDWRDDQFAGILEADEPAIKQMIDTRREQ
jgi:hypothetical protein